MKKIIYVGSIIFLLSGFAHAETCPHPHHSALQHGAIPEHWEISPVSANAVQGEKNAQFIRANILTRGMTGIGVTCTYKISVGEYSIWKQVNVSVPLLNVDPNWRRTLYKMYSCTSSLERCVFYPE